MPITDEDLLDPKLKPGDPEWEGLLALAGEQAPIAPPQAAPTGQPSPADRMGEVAALFKDQQPEPPGPGNEELDYLANSPAPSKGSNWLGSIASAIAASAGDQGANERYQAGQQHATAAREAGVTKARAADQGHRKLDQGSVELLVMGGMSPEAAAKLTYDAPAYKLASSGMGQLAARYRQQDMTAAQRAQSDATKGTLQGERLDAAAERQRIALEASAERQRLALEAKKKGKGGAGGGGIAPEQRKASLVAAVAQSADVPTSVAQAVIDGNTEGVTPEQLDRIQQFQSQLAGMPAKEQNAYLKANMTREATNTDAPQRTVTAKEQDPAVLMKIKNEIDEKGADVGAAVRAWKSLSPSAKNAMAKFGGQGGKISNLIKSGSLSEQDKIGLSEIQNLANALIKAQSGAAVSDGEWGRLATRMGFANQDFDVLGSPAVIGNWIERMAGAAAQMKGNAKQFYPGLKTMWEVKQ